MSGMEWVGSAADHLCVSGKRALGREVGGGRGWAAWARARVSKNEAARVQMGVVSELARAALANWGGAPASPHTRFSPSLPPLAHVPVSAALYSTMGTP